MQQMIMTMSGGVSESTSVLTEKGERGERGEERIHCDGEDAASDAFFPRV